MTDKTPTDPNTALGFTALTTLGPLATKKFSRDHLTGKIACEGYGNAKHFKFRVVNFNDLEDLHEKLQVLQGERQTFIVRGEPLEGVDLSKARRLLGREGNDPATLRPCARAWIMLDEDWQPAPNGIDPVSDLDGAIAFLVLQLPQDLHDVDLIVQWGSSQGVKADKMSAHVFALLDSPVPDEDLKRWARYHKLGAPDDPVSPRPPRPWLDPAVFNPVQPHFTASPVFVGIPDPLAGRRLFLVRRGRRTASLEIPPSLPVPPPGSPTRGVGDCRGYEEHRARIGTEDGFHGPLLSAAGSYIKERGPRGTDADALVADLAAAVREADPGGRTVEEISRYSSDRFLRELVNSIVRKDAAPDPHAEPPTGPYDVQHGCLVYKKKTSDGRVETLILTNFAATIVEEVIVDDGAERKLFFGIEGVLDNGTPLPPIQVPAAQFPGMTWISGSWGSDAVIYSGRDGKDRVRDAIQRLSLTGKRRRTIFQHAGWRKLNGAWIYLHGDGGIGKDGSRSDVEVHLQGGLANVLLPPPPSNVVELARAVLSALPGPDRIKLVLLAAVARAILAEVSPPTFSIFLVGATGLFKSEVATLYQKFFGAGFSPQSLPGNFSSTANALERLCFTAKDCLSVIDEYTPKAVGTREAAELHAKGERIFRAIGNVAARERLTADGQLRKGYTPRGLVVATGEDLPRGQSLLARMLVIEFGVGDITPDDLSRAQLASPDFVTLTAGFILWLAARIDDLKAAAPPRLRELRKDAMTGTIHTRTPDIVASLFLGLDTFVTFLVEGGLPVVEGEDLRRRGWDALMLASAAQAVHLRDSDPVARFEKLLVSLFSSGRAHLLDAKTGEMPPQSVSWGWRGRRVEGSFGSTRLEWQSQGLSLGYLKSDGTIFLDWEAAYAALQRLATEQGENLSLSSRGLLKLLEERGRLLREPGSDKRSVRFTPPGGATTRRYTQLVQRSSGGGTLGKTCPACPTCPADDPGHVCGPRPEETLGLTDTTDTSDTFSPVERPREPEPDEEVA